MVKHQDFILTLILCIDGHYLMRVCVCDWLCMYCSVIMRLVTCDITTLQMLNGVTKESAHPKCRLLSILENGSGICICMDIYTYW